MRLYGGRKINRAIDRRVSQGRELRDAIVYDITEASRYCRVRIQGTNTLIKAWFPENWEAKPSFVRVGNAVRISHPGGSKSGRVEVVGHGFLLPAMIAGGTAPATPEVPDTVLTGCVVSAADPAVMGGLVSAGTFRIDGVVYSLSGLEMDDDTVEMDRLDIEMDGVGSTFTLSAASATYFRYDSICVGADGVVDVVSGSNFAYNASTIPDPPAAPADHIRLGWVLVYPNMTTVTAADINRTFSYPAPAELRVVVADQELAWAELSTTITVSMRDQYGNYIVHSSAGWNVTITWNYGNGTLTIDGTPHDESEGSTSFLMAVLGYKIITYTRDGLVGDLSPTFTIEEAETGLANGTYIILLDSLGAEMF